VFARLHPEVNQCWIASVLQLWIGSSRFVGDLSSHDKRRRIIKVEHLHAFLWNRVIPPRREYDIEYRIHTVALRS